MTFRERDKHYKATVSENHTTVLRGKTGFLLKPGEELPLKGWLKGRVRERATITGWQRGPKESPK